MTFLIKSLSINVFLRIFNNDTLFIGKFQRCSCQLGWHGKHCDQYWGCETIICQNQGTCEVTKDKHVTCRYKFKLPIKTL